LEKNMKKNLKNLILACGLLTLSLQAKADPNYRCDFEILASVAGVSSLVISPAASLGFLTGCELENNGYSRWAGFSTGSGTVLQISSYALTTILLLLKQENTQELLALAESEGEVGPQLKSIVNQLRQIYLREGLEVTEEQVLEKLYNDI
jgi:hypothetical protein